jgi:hypothetical protein
MKPSSLGSCLTEGVEVSSREGRDRDSESWIVYKSLCQTWLSFGRVGARAGGKGGRWVWAEERCDDSGYWPCVGGEGLDPGLTAGRKCEDNAVEFSGQLVVDGLQVESA